MSTVPERPWPESEALGVLYTTTLDNSSEGYWSNCTLRLVSEALTCC